MDSSHTHYDTAAMDFAMSMKLPSNENTAHILCTTPLGGDKVSMLTHTYPHKPLRKIKVTMCNHQADSPLYVLPDVCPGDLQV